MKTIITACAAAEALGFFAFESYAASMHMLSATIAAGFTAWLFSAVAIVAALR